MELQEVATKFVEFVIKKKDQREWQKVKELLEEEIKIVFDLVKASGFEFKEVVVGKAKGVYSDTKESYYFNIFCPCKVIDLKGEDHKFATAWLERVFNLIFNGKYNACQTIEMLVYEMVEYIKRSIPLEPIKLTKYGDFLIENTSSVFFKAVRDHNSLEGRVIGIHKFCNGFLDRHRASEANDVIVCRKCSLRIYIPRHLKTYKQLRDFFDLKLRSKADLIEISLKESKMIQCLLSNG